MTNEEHLGARIMLSFLNASSEWQSIGETPQQNSFLSSAEGLAIRWRDAMDRPLQIQNARVVGSQTIDLGVRASTVAFTELFRSPQPAQLTVEGMGMSFTAGLQPSFGSTRAATVKSGPNIAAVLPSAAPIFPRILAPGMFVSLYGAELSTIAAQASSLPYPTSLGGSVEVLLDGPRLRLQYISPAQINAVLAENITGFRKLTVRSSSGEHTVNVLIEATAPAVFNAAVNALSGTIVSATAPLRPNDYLSLFLTGLGATTNRGGLDYANVQPTVTVGEKSCEVTYAGRAPGYSGLDQINCRIAMDATGTSGLVAVQVRSGQRSSNVINLAFR
jgi:uncharacterized protein (TIGR03437 family)